MPEAKAYGFRAKGKVRFLSGVVTPAQPHYLYGLLDANVDPPLGRAPPILGIAASAGGYQVSSLFWLIQLLTCGRCVSGLQYITTTLLSVTWHALGRCPDCQAPESCWSSGISIHCDSSCSSWLLCLSASPQKFLARR